MQNTLSSRGRHPGRSQRYFLVSLDIARSKWKLILATFGPASPAGLALPPFPEIMTGKHEEPSTAHMRITGP
jgi:hypothetical protein